MQGLNDDGTFHSECITFKTTKGNHSSNLVSSDYEVLNKARPINGDNYWMYLVHYRTAAQAQAASEALVNAFTNVGNADDETLVEHIQVVIFNECYFLFFMRPAPTWYKKPLLCYISKGLNRDLLCEIDYDFWQHVIDEKGKVITMPTPSLFKAH